MTLPYLPEKPEPYAASIARLHARFLSVLPRIRTHARIHFRHLKCPGRREDAVAESTALAWKWFLRLCERDKDITDFVSAVAEYAVRQVRCGRRLCGRERSKDVMSSVAQRRHRFMTCSLPERESGTGGNEAIAALRDNTATPPPEQAAFRIDYPAWLSHLGSRDRSVAQDMAQGESTQDLAPRYNVSQARISQLRRELYLDWRRFHGESPSGG